MKSADLYFILNSVNDYFGIDITEETRKREYVFARIVFCKLARTIKGSRKPFSFKIIGEQINKNHATVIHSIGLFNQLSNQKMFKPYYNAYIRLFKKINNPIFEGEDIRSIVFKLDQKILDLEKENKELKYQLKNKKL